MPNNLKAPELSDAQLALVAQLTGKVSGDESPQDFKAMVDSMKGQPTLTSVYEGGDSAARRILKGASLGASEYVAEKAGARPLSSGGLGDIGLEVAGGMLPALL